MQVVSNIAVYAIFSQIFNFVQDYLFMGYATVVMITGPFPCLQSWLVLPFTLVVDSGGTNYGNMCGVTCLSQNCLTLIWPEVNQTMVSTHPFDFWDDIWILEAINRQKRNITKSAQYLKDGTEGARVTRCSAKAVHASGDYVIIMHNSSCAKGGLA